MLRFAVPVGWALVTACGEPTPAPPDAGLGVVVVAPNGGEHVVAAEPFELGWQVVGAAALPCDVDLIAADGGVTAIAAGVTATSLTWNPPGVEATGTYRLRVTVRADEGASADDSSDATFTISPPATGVSLARDVQPIFTARCTTPFCHGAESQVGLLNLARGAARASLVDVRSMTTACAAQVRVRPGLPDQSYLVWKLAGAGPCLAGVRMPKDAAALPAGEVDRIRTWIAEGAKAN